MKKFFLICTPCFLLVSLLLCLYSWHFAPLLVIVALYSVIGYHDLYQSGHNVLHNYPVIGHLRYLFEFIRPEIQQYFVFSNQSGRPFSREVRSVVYQRAENAVDTLPFGTQQDINTPGYEFAHHSLSPKQPKQAVLRHCIGESQCLKPYNASRLNISAMSFGALSHRAIEALNWGAKMGNFAHNTGEGGLSPYHLLHGGDIIWQIGTAYFGCRNNDGTFNAEKFKENAIKSPVKMIEIKLSQGAKPSHGGILPAAKVDAEIARIRGVAVGEDCISPPAHSAFSTPKELLDFVTQVRELSGGKPVGFKLCIGRKHDFMAICKAMLETKQYPDFITVDGAEGGTGAAPLEFSNYLGLPINEALVFVHNCLQGINMRDKITVISSGKVATAFDIVSKLAIGADCCNAARAMMFTVGCIQSLKCNTNHCPTGVATQDKSRSKAIRPEHKRHHVYNYHLNTLDNFLDLLGAMGYDEPSQLRPSDIYHRVNELVTKHYGELFDYLSPGALLHDTMPKDYRDHWQLAQSDAF